MTEAKLSRRSFLKLTAAGFLGSVGFELPSVSGARFESDGFFEQFNRWMDSTGSVFPGAIGIKHATEVATSEDLSRQTQHINTLVGETNTYNPQDPNNLPLTIGFYTPNEFQEFEASAGIPLGGGFFRTECIPDGSDTDDLPEMEIGNTKIDKNNMFPVKSLHVGIDKDLSQEQQFAILAKEMGAYSVLDLQDTSTSFMHIACVITIRNYLRRSNSSLHIQINDENITFTNHEEVTLENLPKELAYQIAIGGLAQEVHGFTNDSSCLKILDQITSLGLLLLAYNEDNRNSFDDDSPYLKLIEQLSQIESFPFHILDSDKISIFHAGQLLEFTTDFSQLPSEEAIIIFEAYIATMAQADYIFGTFTAN